MFGLSFRLGLGLLILFVPLSRRVMRTLYDPYILYFSSEVIVKFTIKARTLRDTY